MAVSSISVYAILMSGWASNSKYAFLGAIRAAAQMISYEVSIGLILISVLLCVGSLSVTEIVLAQNSGIWFFFSFISCNNNVFCFGFGGDKSSPL